ncbi:U4 snRNA binding protein [Aureococcus anophagefferens]|nr:U4 snRNA binding protein [Aureococcus anophagefferens]
MGGGASKKKDAEWELEYEGHSKAVLCVAFSPCGARVATGSLDGTALVFNAKSGGNQLTLEGHGDGVACTLEGHTGHVLGVAFARDGARVATASGDWTCRIWGVGSGTVETFVTGHIDMVICCAFNHDGTRFATGSADKTIKIWNAARLFNGDTKRFDNATGALLLTFEGHEHHVTSVTYDRKGERLLSSSLDSSVRMWDAAKGDEEFKLKHRSGVAGAAFSECETRV